MYTCRECNEPYMNKSGFKTLCNTCRNGKRRYGMNKLDMKAMHKQQKGKCFLCEKDTLLFTNGLHNSAYIDHNHETGEVRHILCHACNTMVGNIENSKVSPYKLARYIR